MASSRGRPVSGTKKDRAMSAKDFESSNSTTAAFLGGRQKDWMTAGGETPAISKNPSRPAVKTVPPFTLESEPVSDFQWTSQSYQALQNNDFSSLPFPPGFDRGRFPALRRRRRGSKNYPPRSTTSHTVNPASPTPLSPTASSHNQNTVMKESNSHSHNLLPSPSPSIETRRPSTHFADVENEPVEPLSAEAALKSKIEGLIAEFGSNEVKKHLREAEKPALTSFQAATVPTPDATEVPQTNNLASSPPDSNTRNPSEDASILNPQDIPRPSSSASKRASEEVSEPRKRVQSVPEPSSCAPLANSVSTRKSLPQRQDTQRNYLPDQAEMRSFHEDVSRRLQAVTQSSNRFGSAVERPRLGLLRDACDQSDCFYLCLHQIFCLDLQRSRNGMISFLKDEHRSGLSVLSYLLVSNDNLSPDAIEWFSTFPLPWDSLLSSRLAFQTAHMKVLQCLARLSQHWDEMHAQCSRRLYPPLVEELVVLFHVETFTFQQVIFRALLRNIWKGPTDACFQQIEEMFPRIFQEYAHRAMRNVSDNDKKLYNLSIINEFQRISFLHHHHMQEEANRTRGHQQLSQLGPAVSSNNGERVEPAPPRPIATTAQPSSLPRVRTNQPTPTVPLRTETQSASISRLVPAARQHSVQHQHVSMNGTSPQHPSFTQSPISVQSQQSGVSQHSPTQLQPQRPPESRQPSSSWPSQIIGILAQPSPQTFPVPPTLPSNIAGQGPFHSEQNSRPAIQPSGQERSASQHGVTTSPSQLGPRSGARPQQLGDHQNQISLDPSTQFIRANANLNATQPNPTLTALHQAHVRSPIWVPPRVLGKLDNVPRYFRHIKEVIKPPGGLNGKKRHQKWDFNIDQVTAETMVQSIPGPNGSPHNRLFYPGSRLCRIRCIKVNAADELPEQNEWVVSDNVWPPSTAVVLNGTALEIRRKSHHGKDLPIDGTPYLREGKNELSCAVIDFPKTSLTTYAIGVEIIEVLEEQSITGTMLKMPWEEARKRIVDRSQDTDPDVQVVRSQTIIDLTDPFTARLFDVPVRSIHCRHNQCFDRDTFLQTRTGKTPSEPSSPDGFRCPICGCDARPKNLFIDGFLVRVRENLEYRSRLDVKAIILHGDNWEIKEPDKATGEQGDGSGRRHVPRAQTSAGRSSTPREVIAIDED